jgi:hypothetical protein
MASDLGIDPVQTLEKFFILSDQNKIFENIHHLKEDLAEQNDDDNWVNIQLSCVQVACLL